MRPLWMGALLLVSAAVSASETAYFSLPAADRRRLLARGGAAASLLRRPGSLLVALLLANLLVNVGYFSVGAGWSLELAGAGRTWASVAVAVGSVLLLVLCGEIVPKTLALAAPGPLALAGAPVLLVLRSLLTPLVLPGEAVTRLVVHAFRRGNGPAGAPVRRDLKSALSRRAALGSYHAVELSLLHDVVDFGERRAREFMVPRVQVAFLDLRDPPARWRELMAEQPFAQYPVCDGRPDRLLGTVSAARFLTTPRADRRALLEAPFFAPVSIDADRLVVRMQRSDRRLAFLLDEHGGVAGLVGWGALSQAVLGELGAREGADGAIRRRGPDTLVVRGDCPLHRLLDETGVALPARRAGTVAGSVSESLGRVPKPGDELLGADFRLRVARVKGRRAELVLVRTGRRPGA